MLCVTILEAAFAGNGWHVSIQLQNTSLAERGPADWSVPSQVRERLDRELPWILFTHFGVAQAGLERTQLHLWEAYNLAGLCDLFIYIFIYCGSGDEPGEYFAFATRQGKHPGPRPTVHMSFPGVQWSPLEVVYLVFLWLGQIRV